MEPAELNNIDNSNDYFPLPCFQEGTTLVKGQSTKFVSKEEEQERGLDQFEKYPFKPIAKYFRNQYYTDPSRIRTPSTLYQSLQYLKENFFVSILNDKKKIQKIVLSKITHLDNQNPISKKFKLDTLQKILSIVEKQSDLSLIEQAQFQSFYLKSQKQNKQTTAHKIKTLLKPKQNDFKDLIVPEKLVVFLETRLQAIRCELYAQGIVYPKLIMELLKCEIFLYTLKDNEYSGLGANIIHQGLKTVGLDTLLDLSIKQTLIQRNDFTKIYHEALLIAIFRYNTNQLTKLIEDHNTILSNPKLFELLQLRFYIERGNYHKYFTYLRESEEIIVICILLTYLGKMRERVSDVLKSAKIDVKKSWLAFLLGLSIKPEEENQIINLNKNATYVNEKHENKEIESRQKQLKNWMKLEDLFDQLVLSETQIQQSEVKVNNP